MSRVQHVVARQVGICRDQLTDARVPPVAFSLTVRPAVIVLAVKLPRQIRWNREVYAPTESTTVVPAANAVHAPVGDQSAFCATGHLLIVLRDLFIATSAIPYSKVIQSAAESLRGIVAGIDSVLSWAKDNPPPPAIE